MKYFELLKAAINPAVVEAVNRLLRKGVHSNARKHGVASLVDCCHNTTIFYASPEGDAEGMVALGVLASMNLLSHTAMSIHNLAVDAGQPPIIAQGLVRKMVEWVQANMSDPDHTTIQVAVPMDDAGMASFLGSIGFRRWRNHYRLAAVK